jgi:hypothetical protein
MSRFIMRFFLATIVARHQARAFSGSAFQPAKLLSSPITQKVSHNHNKMRLFSTSIDFDELNQKIQAKGDEIRQLKADGLEKTAMAPYIAELLALKAQLPPDENAAPKAEKKQKKEPQKKKAPPPKKVEEMSESELRLTRLAKVEAMREADIEPFEYTFKPNRSSSQLIAEYDGRLEAGEEDEESDVAVAGRIMTRRVFGKLAFFTLQDESGIIQLQFDKNGLGDSFQVMLKLKSCTCAGDICISHWFASLFYFYNDRALRIILMEVILSVSEERYDVPIKESSQFTQTSGKC